MGKAYFWGGGGGGGLKKRGGGFWGGGGGGVRFKKRGGYPFQSNFCATKDKQHFQLLTQCFKNTQQVYSRTGTIYTFFYISMFAVSVWISLNE